MKKFNFLETFFPGYFALVMATGIISIASHLLGIRFAADILLVANLVFYSVLCALTFLRMILFPRRLIADLTDHARGPGFFTFVASSSVLGTQLFFLTSFKTAAFWLWTVGFFIWFIVMYVFFTAATVRSPKPTLETGINGAWLLAIVATQSLSILGVLLAGGELVTHQAQVLFVSLCMFLLGSMLYLLIISIIFYRLMFVNVEARALTPPYWINMGAVAITTLAGATLTASIDGWIFLKEIEPFLKGFTLFFWSTCTWWIPMLILLGGWRHLYKKEPIIYDPQYWGIVFPLGMYATCTFKLAQVFEFDFLMFIPGVFICLAFLTWALAFAGMTRKIAKGLMN